MKIGIDARLIHETGVGRYIQNLVRELSLSDHENNYVIFLRKKDYSGFILPGDRWEKRVAEIRWHTFTEQLVMPWLLWKEKCDIVHIPYFNAPFLYPGKFIITIHDLTILHLDTGRASTFPYLFYKLRRLGYRVVLTMALFRATRIITVSEAVKKDIIRSFGTRPEKISVTYEGIDPVFLSDNPKSKRRLPVTGNYFLYVGNVFPHKNAEIMLEAYREYVSRAQKPVSLVFVGQKDYFYRRLESVIGSLGFADKTKFLHDVDDRQLYDLYMHATALLFPSLMEGFGLPAIEALSVGCRVLASDIPVFHEILGDHAVFVRTDNVSEFSAALSEIVREPYDRKSLRDACKQFLKRYDWSVLATKTLLIYRDNS